MAANQFDLDDGALAEAIRPSGVAGEAEAIELRHRPIAALDHCAAAAQAWDYEGWREMRSASKTPAG